MELKNFERMLRRVGVDYEHDPEFPDLPPHAQVGDFMIRASHNYYFVVTGRIPLAVARELYASEIGRSDIRVSGHCMCPEPVDPWLEYYDSNSGKRIYSLDERADLLATSEQTTIASMKEFADETLAKSLFMETRPEDAAYVTMYHIDSELGLLVFLQTLDAHGLLGVGPHDWCNPVQSLVASRPTTEE